VLALATERAVEVFLGAGTFFVGHEIALESVDASMITKRKTALTAPGQRRLAPMLATQGRLAIT
jgi:hypothetical protein